MSNSSAISLASVFELWRLNFHLIKYKPILTKIPLEGVKTILVFICKNKCGKIEKHLKRKYVKESLPYQILKYKITILKTEILVPGEVDRTPVQKRNTIGIPMKYNRNSIPILNYLKITQLSFKFQLKDHLLWKVFSFPYIFIAPYIHIHIYFSHLSRWKGS